MVQRLLQRAADNQTNEIVIEAFAKRNLAPFAEGMSPRHDQHQPILHERQCFELLGGVNRICDDTDLAVSLRYGWYDFAALAFLKVYVDIWVRCQKGHKRRRQEFNHCNGVGENAHMAPQSPCELV